MTQTRKSSLRTVLNPQLWPWGERLQHEKQTDLFRNLKFHDWLVTADHQTKLTSSDDRLSLTSRETLSYETNRSASRVQVWEKNI